MLIRILALSVAAACLGACGGGGGGGSSGPNPDGGTARSFSRTDGAVTSSCNLVTNVCTATQVVTISNDSAGATQGVVALTGDAASITSSATASGYQVQVTFSATAPSDSGARAALATMGVSHRDGTDPGVLYLDNHISVPNYRVQNTNRTATAVVTLPQSLSYDLIQHVGAGSVSSTGLAGPSADFDSGSGNASLGGTWERADVTSGSGTITVSADAASLNASTGSGGVTVTLPSLRATQATLSAGSGLIDATVSHAGNGVFDADAQSDVGSATVSITGTAAVGTQTSTHQHYRSSNYDSANPKIAVTAHSGSGSTSIHD